MAQTLEEAKEWHKSKWWDDEFHTVEGFHLRDDGKVEIEADKSPGGNIVDGEYYNRVEIVTREKAWNMVLDSSEFKESQAVAIKVYEEDGYYE